MGEYSAVSGIKVLDRAVAIMMAAANRPSSLSELCDTTGLPRATVHRLATALEAHRILSRTPDGRWSAGPALPGNRDHLIEIARPIMQALCAATGESVQLYQHTGNTRTCVAAVEPEQGLHNVVPVGRELPLTHGSAAHVIAAFERTDAASIDGASFSNAQLDAVREQGYAESIEERETGLASISAPIFDNQGTLMAVLSVSGSSERFRPSPAEKFGQALRDTAADIAARI